MKRYQIWITHSILLIGLVFCIIFAQVGCGDTVIPDSIYEEKVTVHFTDTIEVFHGSNVRLATGAIYIDDCKEFNDNKLVIEYYNVKYYYREDIK